MSTQVGALWKISTQQAIRVLVRAPLPRTVWIVDALELPLAVYPEAYVSVDERGVTLRPSQPAVPKL